MRKAAYLAIILILVAFIPIIQQEYSGCSVFGYDHLVSKSVITTADSCSTTLISLPLLPGVILSLLFSSNSAYLNYIFIGLVSGLFYIVLISTYFRMCNGANGNRRAA